MSELSFQLPRVINPYPDELFGSWVTRVILRNGVKTWDYLAECAGYTYRPRGYDDLNEYSERFNRLLSALRISYIDAQNNLSTHPFWLALGRSEADFVKENDSEEQLLKKLSRGNGTSLRVRGMRLKWCAECISTSELNPHWQRAHQLPSSIVCHIHGRMLHWHCPFCGKSKLANSRILISLPDVNCGCGGGNPINVGEVYEPSEALRKLAIFSSDAVRGGLPRWNRHHLIHVAREEIIRNFGTYTEMYSFMQSRYSMIRGGYNSIRREFYSGGKLVEALHVWGVVNYWTPPMFACFFSSIEWSYSRLCERLRETVGSSVSVGLDAIERDQQGRIGGGRRRNNERKSRRLTSGGVEAGSVSLGCADNGGAEGVKAYDPEGSRRELETCDAAFARISLPTVFPRKVTKIALAIEMGLSTHGLGKLMARQAEFAKKVSQYNESLPRRRIEFSLQKMGEAGVRKSALEILTESSLTSCNSSTYSERMNMIYLIAQSREEWRSLLIPPGGMTVSHVSTD